jgi:hypothetical protein
MIGMRKAARQPNGAISPAVAVIGCRALGRTPRDFLRDRGAVQG